MTVSLAVGLLLELMLGRLGIPVPFVSLVAFHHTVLRKWWMGFLLSWCFGVLLDMSYGRSCPVHFLLIPVITVLARIWRANRLTHLLLLQAAPGFVIGLLNAVAMLLARLQLTGKLQLLEFWPMLRYMLFVMMTATITMPLVCWLLDRQAARLGLQRYTHVGVVYVPYVCMRDYEEQEDA